MSLQVVIPDKDPLINQLEEQAVARGLAATRKLARKKLPRLARSLLSERLRDLREKGDPMAVDHKQTSA